MLNKELLIASAKKKEQRKVKLTIGRYESFGMIAFGYNKDFYGSLDVVPYWGDYERCNEFPYIFAFCCLDDYVGRAKWGYSLC